MKNKRSLGEEQLKVMPFSWSIVMNDGLTIKCTLPIDIIIACMGALFSMSHFRRSADSGRKVPRSAVSFQTLDINPCVVLLSLAQIQTQEREAPEINLSRDLWHASWDTSYARKKNGVLPLCFSYSIESINIRRYLRQGPTAFFVLALPFRSCDVRIFYRKLKRDARFNYSQKWQC